MVAVSGGVDSMVLLHALVTNKSPDIKLVVAHFDHGIRHDSNIDRRLVQSVARQHGLPFVYEKGQLGEFASEATARVARYTFLHRVRDAAAARAIITAHHQDDVLETAILNLMRGTHRRGLSSLKSTDTVFRPLLHSSKAELQSYAAQQQLQWREDVTNDDTKYLRNHIRHNIVTPMNTATRAKFIDILRTAAATNELLDSELQDHLAEHHSTGVLDKQIFNKLPIEVAREVLATWLRNNGITNYDRKTLARLVTAAQGFTNGSLANITGDYFLKIGRDQLALELRDR